MSSANLLAPCSPKVALDDNCFAFLRDSPEMSPEQSDLSDYQALMESLAHQGFDSEFGCLVVSGKNLPMALLKSLLAKRRVKYPNSVLQLYRVKRMPRGTFVPQPAPKRGVL